MPDVRSMRSSINKLSHSSKVDIPLGRWSELMKRAGTSVRFTHWCLVINDPRTTGFSAAEIIGTPTAMDAQQRLWDLELGGSDVKVTVERPCWAAHASTWSTSSRSQLGSSRRRIKELKPLGIGDELVAALTSEGRWWGSLSLYRESTDQNFTDSDVQTAAELVPSLTDAARLSWIKSVPWPRPLPKQAGLLLLDSAGEAIGSTSVVNHWISRLDADTQHAGRLIRCLLAQLNGHSRDEPNGMGVRSLICDSFGGWIELSASRVENRRQPDLIAITFQGAAPEDISDVRLHAYPFTTREREIASLTIANATTKGIAAQLGLSPHTVADHLKSIFAKTGAHSRNHLARTMSGLTVP